MSELKLPRLLAAAKEFNVGQDTLLSFLVGKGFNRDDLKPTAKLNEAMYRALQQEFQNDKTAKNKADLVEIPKTGTERRQRRDEEDLSIRREEKKPVFKDREEQAVQSPVAIAPPVIPEAQQPPAAIVEQPEIQEPVQEVPVIVEPVAQIQTPEPVEPIEPIYTTPDEPEILRIEAPELESPKVLDKIDLSAIDSSTRPRKNVVREKQPEIAEVETLTEEAPEEPAPVDEPVAAEIETFETEETPSEESEEAPVIENIKAEKLEGPKILGKIDLPVDSETRPRSNQSRDEKRKRKRIPVDKKGDIAPHSQTSFNPQARGGAGNSGQPFGTRTITPQRSGQGAQTGSNGQAGGGNRPALGGQRTAATAASSTPRIQINRNPGGGNNRNGQQGGGHGHGRNDRFQRPEDKEIDQKQIQDKIKETQAKLSGQSGRGKSLKARYRREKRQEAAEAMGVNEDNRLQVTEFVTVSELANLMDVNFTDIISKCMSLGIMVSINQRLDAEVIELVAGEFGYEVEFLGLDDLDEDDGDDEEDEDDELQKRAPIVTIMGHVDHGKTSLLDYIRNANVVAGEAGGITQHIGAYEVTLPTEDHITFLDTPGHEAFTAMRARGAKVTDIAVIVVAADDAVMPQTKEAISHAQAAGVPMIFAVNKIDKDGANPQKIYEQLSQMNILVEEWGGKFQSQELSAKKGLNVDSLLEKILLEAEILDLKANPDREATGSIIEASLDKGRGYVATVLVQNGSLKLGDIMVSGQHYGRIKAMFNERNQRVNEAPPSTPVQILGLNGAPQAGEKFKVYEDEAEAKEVATKRAQISREQGLRAKKHITLDEIGRRLALGNFKELNVIIKGDVDGSVEALSDSLQKLSTEEIAINVVHKAVGQISESDVLLATASDAILIGFNVRPSTQANRLADTEGVQIKMYSIIYNAIEEVKSAMEGLLEPKIQEKEVATVEIREVYKFDKATVAGCYVTEGKMRRDSKIRLFRDGILIYPRTEGGFAELGSLKRFKDDVKDVAAGYECGLTIKNFADINVGDTVIAIEEEEIKRTL